MTQKVKFFAVVFSFLCLSTNVYAKDIPTSSLTGTWHSSSPAMVARVTHHTITINLIIGGNSYLYWKGSIPSKTIKHSHWLSKADRWALNNSKAGSVARVKGFRYKKHTIRFSFTVLDLDLTRTISLRR